MISISYLKPLREAWNIKSVNHVTNERECLGDSAWKRVKTFVGVKMTFTKVISKLLRRQNFAVVRKNLDSTTTAFAECRRKFRGLGIQFHLTVFTQRSKLGKFLLFDAVIVIYHK